MNDGDYDYFQLEGSMCPNMNSTILQGNINSD